MKSTTKRTAATIARVLPRRERGGRGPVETGRTLRSLEGATRSRRSGR